MNYELEDDALERKAILLKIKRKSNSKRIDSVEQKLEKVRLKKRLEKAISYIKNYFQEQYMLYYGRLSNKLFKEIIT